MLKKKWQVKVQKKLKKEYKSLSEFVVKRREALSLSQDELSDKCALDIETLKSIENGLELFLATTVRQKLAHGLKVENKEIKLYESKYSTALETNENKKNQIRELILMNYTNPDFIINCPICGEKLNYRVAKLYDLENNLVLHPKAQCSKCPFQLKD